MNTYVIRYKKRSAIQVVLLSFLLLILLATGGRQAFGQVLNPGEAEIQELRVSGCYQDAGSKATVTVRIDWETVADLTVSLDSGAQTITFQDIYFSNSTNSVADAALPTLQQIAFELAADGATHTIEVYYDSAPGVILATETFTAPAACEPLSCDIANNDLGGVVFSDLNQNGLIDVGETPGVADITVTAIDVNGNTGTTMTDEVGEYLFSGLTFPIRVEFSDIPNAYNSTASNSSTGADNGTTVQFVDAPSCNVDLGAINPSHACVGDVDLFTTRFGLGDPLATDQEPGLEPANTDSVYVYDYGLTNNDANFTNEPGTVTLASAADTGSVWGTAYDRYTEQLYTSAVLRRHTGLGEDGLGAIYVSDLSGGAASATTSLFVDLTTLGINVGGPADTNAARDLVGDITEVSTDLYAWNNLGKVGLGDFDVDASGQLYVTNLNSQTLVQVAADGTAATEYAIPNPGCEQGQWRPWALTVEGDQVYVGGVCDASDIDIDPPTDAVNGINAGDVSQADLDTFERELAEAMEYLSAHVYQFDINSNTFNPTSVFDVPLTYPRGTLGGGGAISERGWYPWVGDGGDEGTTFDDMVNAHLLMNNTGRSVDYHKLYYASPMFTDIEFDTDGSMLLGFSDRTGLMMGYQQAGPNGENSDDYGATIDNNSLWDSESGGDVLRAYESGGMYFMESAGNSGPYTGVGSGEAFDFGYGSAEFFDDSLGRAGHNEILLGALTVNHMAGEIVVSAVDPGNTNSGGIRYLDAATGADVGNLNIYWREKENSIPGAFAKSSGIGDVELLCAPPTELQIGNRVWFDADNNGIQDPGEVPLEGVVVDLLDAMGNNIGMATTDINGEYYFDVLPNTAYTISIDTAQLTTFSNVDLDGDGNADAGTTFADLFPSPTNADGETGNDLATDIRDSDGIMSGMLVQIPYITGNYNENNHSLDVGFSVAAEEEIGRLGDLVFHDEDSNGIYDPTIDTLIPGVVITLTDSTGGVTTTVTGLDGRYQFDELLLNATYTLTVDTSNLPVGKSPLPTGVISNMADDTSEGTTSITLELTDTITENLTADFGFGSLGLLGNTIFHDIDGDGVYNPAVGDLPISGVDVTLTDEGGNQVTVQTDGNGSYEFSGLDLNEMYTVTMDVNDLPNSKNPDPTSGTGADQVSSGTITLTTTLTGDNRQDPTLDFGFEPYGEIGNQLFHDLDGDGVYEPSQGEFPLDGVTLTLVGSNGVSEMVTTDVNGMYLFDELPLQETYTVTVDTTTLPTSKVSTPTTAPDPNDPTINVSSGVNELVTTLTYLDPVDETLDFGYEPLVPDIEIVKLAGTAADGNVYTITAPSVVAYSYIIRNTGETYLTGTIVTDDLGTESPADDVTITAANCPDLAAREPLAPFEQAICELGLFVDRDVTNVADVIATPSEPDGTEILNVDPPTDDDPAEVIYDQQLPAIKIIKTAGDAADGQTYTINELGMVVFSYTVTNVGESHLISVTITDDAATATTADDVLLTDTQCPGLAGPIAPGDSVQCSASIMVNGNHLNIAMTEGVPSDPGGNVLEGVPNPMDEDPADVEYAPDGSIGNLIFHDSDRDGVYEPGEGDFPLEGVEVTLTASDGTTRTLVTDVNGDYLFTELPFDTYTVTVDTTTLPGTKFVDPTADPENDGDSTSSVTITQDDPSDVDQDFGYPPLGKLGSTIFHDMDGDGVYDGTLGDFPLSDVVVELTDSSGNVVTMTTDGNGFYEFVDLPLNGTYTVTVDTDTLPDSKNEGATGDDGLMADETSEGTNILTTTLTADMPEDPTLDFGYEPLGVIGDTIFHDANNDGVYDPADGDFPLPNVDVILTDSNGVTQTAATNAFGQYFFTDLPFDTYTVEVDTSTLPIDKVTDPTTDPEEDGNNVSEVTLDPDSPSDLEQDFGYQPLGMLGNTIFHDADGDGMYEPNEDDFPLDGVEVTLTLPDGSTQTTMTDGNGFYQFTDLALDETYTVTVNTGTLPNSKNEGATGDDGLTADQTSEGTITLTTTLTSGENGMPSDATLDFGFEPLGSLGSTIFHDMDGDGVYEPNAGDFPLDGVVVELTDSSGNSVTTTTDTNGMYLFDELPLGETYTVTVDTTTLSDAKWEGATGDDTLAGDETSEGVSVLTTTLTVDMVNDPTLDFGYQPRGVIGDFIFHDADGDGIYEPNAGDFPLEGVVVELEDSSGNTMTATTDVNGEYQFTELPFDNYTVTVDSSTLPMSKTVNPTSDPENDGNNSSSVSLTPDNPSDLDQDFSYQPLGTLGNTIFHDLDADGMYEPNAGEFPLDGVEVTLTYPDGTTATATTDGNGFYEFSELPLNETYTVTVDTSTLPVSKNPDATGDSTNSADQTSEGVIELTTLLTDEMPNDPTLDFGFTPYGAIGDTIFHDQDGDGVYEPDMGDFPLSGVEVILTDSNGVTETATTDQFGEYLFTGLEFGDYTVEVNGDTLPVDKAPDPTADPEGDENNTSSVTLTPSNPEDLDQDFGYQPLGALGSTIFHDINNDGVYDPSVGDFPLSDVLVTLTDSSGDAITMTTDGNGMYQFTDLALDETYTVTVDTNTLPEMKDPTATGDDSLTADETSEGVSVLTATLTADAPNDPTLDFGYQPLGTVGTTIFHDTDNDGVYEPNLGEFPLEGVVVTLTGSNGTVLTMTTDVLGNYAFTGLALDETYTVTVDANTLPSSKAAGATGDDGLTADQTSEGTLVLTTTLTTEMPSDPTLDFGFQAAGTIGDFIFHDLDGDGIYDPNDGEFPLQGVEVTLTDGNGNEQTAVTDPLGRYLFTDLPFGEYTVEVDEATLPDGKSLAPSSDPENDGNNNSTVLLTPDDPDDLDQDFGYQPLGALGSLLFHDADADGVYEPQDGDFPLENVAVTLTYPDGSTDQTQTDQNGFYQFTDLPLDATYSVSVDTATLPDSKSADPTGDGTLTADQTSEGVITLETMLTADDPNDQTLDFGFQPKGVIGDFIFHDLDGDGIYEPNNGEFPLQGVEVTLTDEDGNETIAVTNELGQYLFTDLPLDETYTIEVDETTLPDGKSLAPSADPEGDGDNMSEVTLTADNPSDLDQDFGYQPLGALGNTIFHDLDADGVYEPQEGDFPLADVELMLTYPDGTTETTTTDPNGFYQFTDLPLDGTYTVDVDESTLPDSKSEGATGDDSLTDDQTSEGTGTLTATLTADMPNDQTLDFGYQPLGTIGDFIFHDLDGDGIYEPNDGEFPLQGVEVVLSDADGNEMTAVTDELGQYQFTDLPFGDYTVTVDLTSLPQGKSLTPSSDPEGDGNNTSAVTLTAEEPSDLDQDFGYQPLGALGSLLFHDIDADGIYEPDNGEFPLEGVTVVLSDENGDTQTTTTNETGFYQFTELPFGEYTVSVDETTLPNSKATGATGDSGNTADQTSEGVSELTTTLTADEPNDQTLDFGYQPRGAIGDFIFHDADGDGIYEPNDGDVVLPGVEVTLTDSNGVTQTTTTDINGAYLFDELPFDTYTVDIDTTTLPDGKSPNPTSDPENDGDNSSTVTLTADDPVDLDQDFSYQPLGALGNTIFHDTDNDGVYEPADGEFPLDGIVVTLTYPDGTTAETTTDENGFYQFTDLPLDATYSVTVDTTSLPDSKSPAPTGDESLTADQTSEGVITLEATLTADNPNDPTLDFGFQPKGVIGDFIFHDLDGDGLYEPNTGEFPLQGIEVTLTDEDGNEQTTMTDELGQYLFTDLLLDETYTVEVDETTLPDDKSLTPSADPEGDGNNVSSVTLTANNPSDLDQDFGYQPLGSLGTLIFHDSDADGIYEPSDGDLPLEGVVVTLRLPDGTTEQMTTDANGFYQFTGLALDETYIVEVETSSLPEGKAPAATGDGSLTADQTSEGVIRLEAMLTADMPNDPTLDFGFQSNGLIGDFIFHDMDGDGVFDPNDGEFPLEGVTVLLTDSTGNTMTDTTDINGGYLFTDLPFGDYVVTVDTTTLPLNKSIDPSLDPEGDGNSMSSVTLTADAPNDLAQDFGYRPLGELGTFLFHDTDGDGVYEPSTGEFPLEGVRVILSDATGDIAEMLTDNLGQYLFTDLPLGETYTVRVDTATLPENKEPTATLGDINTDEDSKGSNELTTELTALAPTDYTLDFGYQPRGTIGDFIFQDLDGDGVYEPQDAEYPLVGVEVVLTDAAGMMMIDTTDELGHYQFVELPFGVYTVTVETATLPEGKAPNPSMGEDSVGSNVISTILSAETPSDNMLDFGYEPIGYIGTRVFHDLDGDGIYEPDMGEFPLEGVEVLLTTPDGTVITTTTDMQGLYNFANLPFGSYTVAYNVDTLPANKLLDPTTGLSVVEVTLTDDDPSEVDINFGFQPDGFIGDVIFHDIDGDGVYEPEEGEEPLANVGVSLTLPDGLVITTTTDTNGNYLFTGLSFGEYTVTVDPTTLPSDKNMQPTMGDDSVGANVASALLSDEMPSNLEIDFGYAPRGIIDGTLFHDANEDGIFNMVDGDFYLDSVIMTLQTAMGDVMTTTTDSDGFYAFRNLPLDQLYTVSVNTSSLPTEKFPNGTEGIDSVGGIASVIFLSDQSTDPNTISFSAEATISFGFAVAKPTSVSFSTLSASTGGMTWIPMAFVLLTGGCICRKQRHTPLFVE